MTCHGAPVWAALPRRARMVGLGRHAVGRGLDDLQRAGLAVVALALGDDRAHEVARDRVADEEHVAAVGARDARAAEGQRVDAQLELLPALRARWAGGGGGGGRGGAIGG